MLHWHERKHCRRFPLQNHAFPSVDHSADDPFRYFGIPFCHRCLLRPLSSFLCQKENRTTRVKHAPIKNVRKTAFSSLFFGHFFVLSIGIECKFSLLLLKSKKISLDEKTVFVSSSELPQSFFKLSKSMFFY